MSGVVVASEMSYKHNYQNPDEADIHQMPEERWLLDYTLEDVVTDEVSIPHRVASKLVRLFAEGNEVAYIARYRADAHEGMSCDQIRQSFKIFNETKELNKKVEKAIANVSSKIKNEGDLTIAVERLKSAREPADITEVTQLYASARKTKASIAREMGLEDVAQAILDGRSINLEHFVGSKPELKNLKVVEEHIANAMADLLNKMQETQDAVKRISRMETTAFLCVCCELSNKAKKWTENDKSYRLISNFNDYLNFKKDARKVENYQILAMDRGEENEVLTWKIEVAHAEKEHPGISIRVAPAHQELFVTALNDSISRLFIPKIQRTIRRLLLARAEEAAISCFAHNLRHLFWREGVTAESVIALDPGYSACKAALLTSTGSVVETAEFGLNGKNFDQRGENLLIEWVGRAGDGRVVFAIGNGKASLETQMAVATMIRFGKFGPRVVRFCTVPENGASKYSITPLAEEDLPNMPPTQRSAVSIGRRLIDPMAEYVKIEPKHLGMGMYQHSVNAKKLSEALALVVRECVSMRGVDVNVASVQLLEKVCGLNKKTAAGLVALREQLGRISSREEIKGVKGLGAKSFEQCAGFLIVTDACENGMDGPKKKKKKVASEPLDRTIIHPSQYGVARSLLSRIGLRPSDLPCQYLAMRLQGLTGLTAEEAAVRDLFCTEIKTLPPPDLMVEIRKIASLKVGEHVVGRVANQVEFGLFVDIGAEKSALAHRSNLRQPYPEVGSSLMFVIMNVDTKKGRISVKPLE
ncbi:hypothetical protein Y032_0215g2360 [Ancylostoma ceylanicum]|nr:hypothetical protein Y032_0215g2360 [Ancylostoma ceylanicum]